jgi:predicted  nucleic acid-binding Zn-ribbon protein
MISNLISKELRKAESSLRNKFNQAIKKVQELEIDTEHIVATLEAEFVKKWQALVAEHSTKTVTAATKPAATTEPVTQEEPLDNF